MAAGRNPRTAVSHGSTRDPHSPRAEERFSPEGHPHDPRETKESIQEYLGVAKPACRSSGALSSVGLQLASQSGPSLVLEGEGRSYRPEVDPDRIARKAGGHCRLHTVR